MGEKTPVMGTISAVAYVAKARVEEIDKMQWETEREDLIEQARERLFVAERDWYSRVMRAHERVYAWRMLASVAGVAALVGLGLWAYDGHTAFGTAEESWSDALERCDERADLLERLHEENLTALVRAREDNDRMWGVSRTPWAVGQAIRVEVCTRELSKAYDVMQATGLAIPETDSLDQFLSYCPDIDVAEGSEIPLDMLDDCLRDFSTQAEKADTRSWDRRSWRRPWRNADAKGQNHGGWLWVSDNSELPDLDYGMAEVCPWDWRSYNRFSDFFRQWRL